MNNKQLYPFVDYVKFLFAIIIIAIHTLAFSEFTVSGKNFHDVISRYLFDFAVPFFFVSSGFFLYRKIKRCQDKEEYSRILKNYTKRLITPYLVWGTWYFIIRCIGEYIESKELLKSIGTNLRLWVLSGPGGGMWYVQAVLLMVIILYFIGFERFKKCKYILICIFWALAAICGALYDMQNSFGFASAIVSNYEAIFSTRLNFVFYGIYFFIGFLVSDLLDHVNKKKSGTLLVLSYVTYFVCETIGGYLFMVAHVVKIVVPAALFMILCKLIDEMGNIGTKTEQRANLARTYSSIIYFTHFTLVYASIFACHLLHIERTDYSVAIWLALSVILIVFAIAITKLDKNRRIIGRIY